jgi:hypothetical protein
MKTHHPLWRVAALSVVMSVAGVAHAFAINGAIFTTTASGQTVNGNNYDLKTDVYLDGGPNNPPGCSGGKLDDGDYYFQVTDPSGAVLLSSDAITARAFRVSGGEITANLGIPAHANGATSPCGSLAIQLMPYNDTPNDGGVYKVWITRISDFNAACTVVGIPDCGLQGFVPGNTKTDNFRVKENVRQPPEDGALEAIKFYDANASGTYDAGDILLPDWKMTLTSAGQGVDSTKFTDASGSAVWQPLVPASDYFVTEGTPSQTNWVHSATIYVGHDGSPQNPAGPLTVVANQTTEVAFGNYCTVPPNGRTLGFWSNKNGQVLVDAGDLALLVSLNLRTATGGNFDPGNYAALKTWLLNATSVNMAYMLSVQLATMELNVNNGFVSGGAYYVPAGMTVSQLMAAANTTLGIDGNTPSGDPLRAYQEQLKNWLDQLNNNAGVLSPTPCAYTFP